MNRLREVLRLVSTTNLADREISRSIGVSHNTVRRYRQLVRTARKTWAELESLTDDELDRQFNASPGRLVHKQHPDWAWVHQQMQHCGMTLTLVWEEYRDANPDAALAYSQFTSRYRRHVRKLHPRMRQIHRPGERAFLDFSGKRPCYVDRSTGERVPVELFVGVLGCSDYAFAWACPNQSLPNWINANVHMLEAFGGVPAMLVPDNLRSAVTKAGRDLVINRAYQEMATHYGTVVVPARPRRPRDKSKVEGMVLIVQRWVLLRLRHRTFFSLLSLNRAIAELMDELNRRPFKKLPGSRLERFEELDKPALLPLPAQRFEFGEWTAIQTVPDDYHVHVAKHWYSVPYTYIGREVEGRATATSVEIYCSGVRIATHPRGVEGGTTTDPNHMSKAHRAWAERSQEHFLEWAASIGPATRKVFENLFDRRNPALAYPACDRLKSLARRHSAASFEAAAQRAIELRSPSEKTLRALLANQRHRQAHPRQPDPTPPPSTHDNIRGGDYFAEGSSK